MRSLWLELEEYSDRTHAAANGMAVWGAIAYEIDRAFNQDKDCKDCTNLRVLAAVHQYVGPEDYLGDYRAAMALARDDKQNLCEKHRKNSQ